mmetsp:Transcript_95407/g.246599  ORF Transcript_95407/g.246599 Transcript_95407/m.246599 type:complete len:274 (-) Transcript_95407:104-925(-)
MLLALLPAVKPRGSSCTELCDNFAISGDIRRTAGLVGNAVLGDGIDGADVNCEARRGGCAAAIGRSEDVDEANRLRARPRRSRSVPPTGPSLADGDVDSAGRARGGHLASARESVETRASVETCWELFSCNARPRRFPRLPLLASSRLVGEADRAPFFGGASTVAPPSKGSAPARDVLFARSMPLCRGVRPSSKSGVIGQLLGPWTAGAGAWPANSELDTWPSAREGPLDELLDVTAATTSKGLASGGLVGAQAESNPATAGAGALQQTAPGA